MNNEYEEGCTPTDVRVMREANWKFAEQVQKLEDECDALKESLRDALRLLQEIEETPHCWALWMPHLRSFIHHNRTPAPNCGTNGASK